MFVGGGESYDCDWTVIISPNLTCNGVPMDGCTYFEQKVIYLNEWDACIMWHEITQHAQKENYQNHYMTNCWDDLKAEQSWSAYMAKSQ